MDNSAITEISPWIRYPAGFLFVAFIVVIVGYGAARNRRRLQRFAQRQNLRYLSDGTIAAHAPSDTMLASLGPMGADPQVHGAAAGTIDGHDVVIYECGFVRDLGKGAGYPVTVVQLDAGRSLPHFTLRPEKLRHKFAAAMGNDDIDLDQCPGFSKRFLLHGGAPSAVRDMFSAEICALLERDAALFAESYGNFLLLYHRPRMFRFSKFRHRDADRLLTLGREWIRLLERNGKPDP